MATTYEFSRISERSGHSATITVRYDAEYDPSRNQTTISNIKYKLVWNTAWQVGYCDFAGKLHVTLDGGKGNSITLWAEVRNQSMPSTDWISVDPPSTKYVFTHTFDPEKVVYLRIESTEIKAGNFDLNNITAPYGVERKQIAYYISSGVHIDNGSGWDRYQPYIDTGTGWVRYGARIDNGSSWNNY